AASGHPVHLLVRGQGLAETMSTCLLDRIAHDLFVMIGAEPRTAPDDKPEPVTVEALLHGIPYHRGLEPETRASAGPGDHGSRARRRKPPQTTDRVCPQAPAVICKASCAGAIRQHVPERVVTVAQRCLAGLHAAPAAT